MKTLIKFNEFVKEITAGNGSNYKKQVLEKYKNDEDIKYYLNFVYNPYITTGISDKKLGKDSSGVNLYKNTIAMDEDYLDGNIKQYLDSFYIPDALGRVSNTGSDLDIARAQMMLDRVNTNNLTELLTKIITKNLPLGIDTKTINSVIPSLIPTFNVQLANKYFDNPKIVDGKNFALTEKIDGGRIIALKENGVVSFYTRQGQKYEGLVDLEKEMQEHFPDNICLDGEITLLNKGNLTSKEQYKQTMKITRADGEKHGIKMLVFDMMSVDEFRTQKCDIPYHSRRDKLNTIFTQAESKKYFELLPVLYTGTDTSKITELLNKITGEGGEGVMINILDAPYDFKRTNNLLKVKKMQDLDLEVVGFEEGTNRHSGRLGALLVQYKGNIVKVGSGFTDELRIEIWNNREDWLGRTVSVQYFEETTNQNGGISLRFPVYLDYRTDK